MISEMRLGGDIQAGVIQDSGPAPAPIDESHRQTRKRYIVRSAQLSMGVLVGVAVAATLSTQAGRLSATRLLCLAVAGCAYVAWTLYGTRDAARFALWHHRLGPALSWPLPGVWRSILQLTVQFALAELLIWLAAPAGAAGLLWIVLLPPVGIAVIFVRPPAVVLVAA